MTLAEAAKALPFLEVSRHIRAYRPRTAGTGIEGRLRRPQWAVKNDMDA